MQSTIKEDLKVETEPASTNPTDWEKHGWFYISVRIGFFLWVQSAPFELGYAFSFFVNDDYISIRAV